MRTKLPELRPKCEATLARSRATRQRMVTLPPLAKLHQPETHFVATAVRTAKAEDYERTERTDLSATRRLTTQAERVMKRERLPTHLYQALQVYVRWAAAAQGVIEGTSARLIASWSGGGGGGGFGSRTPSHMTLEGAKVVQAVKGAIPAELMALFEEIVAEEMGALSGRPRGLTDFGRDIGYQQMQQATASGQQQLYDLCAIIHHAVRERWWLDIELDVNRS